MHSGVVNGISPDPSVLQIPKEKGLGPPNNGPKLHRPVRHKPLAERPSESTSWQSIHTQVFWPGTGQRRKSDGLDTTSCYYQLRTTTLIYQPKDMPKEQPT